jgi:hypothetical protein
MNRQERRKCELESNQCVFMQRVASAPPCDLLQALTQLRFALTDEASLRPFMQ